MQDNVTWTDSSLARAHTLVIINHVRHLEPFILLKLVEQNDEADLFFRNGTIINLFGILKIMEEFKHCIFHMTKCGNPTYLCTTGMYLNDGTCNFMNHICVYCSADEKFDGTYPTNVVVYSNGNMMYVPPGMFKSTCNIDITWYPFDTQNCQLKFGSWSYDGGSIDLKLQCPDNNKTERCHEEGYGDTKSFMENGEWELKG